MQKLTLMLPNRNNFRRNFPNAWAAGSAVRTFKNPASFYVFENSKSKSKIFRIHQDGKAIANVASYANLLKHNKFIDLVKSAEKDTIDKRKNIKRGNFVRVKKYKTGWLSKYKRVNSVNHESKTIKLSKSKKEIPLKNVVLTKAESKAKKIINNNTNQ